MIAERKIVDRIIGVFERHADKAFIIEEPLGVPLSYGEFFQMALKARDMLKAKGLNKGDKVVLILPNSSEYAALYFGILMLGAVAVPINQALHPKEINFILSRIKIQVIVFSVSTRPLVLSAAEGIIGHQLCLLLQQEKAAHHEEVELPVLDQGPAVHQTPQEAFAANTDEDIFTITFTSGTTSKPKGVIHRVSSQFGSALSFNQALEVNQSSRFIDFWPMAYSTGILNNLLCPFMAAGSVVITPVFDIRALLNFWQPVISRGVNTLWLSPSMLATLVYVDRNPEGIKYCQIQRPVVYAGTAPLPLKVRKDFEHKYQVPVYESYGLSELLFISANLKQHPLKEGSVGHVLPGVNVHIMAEDGQAIQPPGDGEIVVETPFLMQGYLNLESDQVKTYPKGELFPTGDIGHFDAQGHLFITGRKKDLIIRGGMNISPRVIEELILTHPAVEQVCVFGIPHDYYGEEIVAVVKCKAGRNLDEEKPALLKLCRTNLNDASVPSRFIQKDSLPTTNTGKVQKNKLRDEVLASLASKG